MARLVTHVMNGHALARAGLYNLDEFAKIGNRRVVNTYDPVAVLEPGTQCRFALAEIADDDRGRSGLEAQPVEQYAGFGQSGRCRIRHRDSDTSPCPVVVFERHRYAAV